MYRFRSLHDIDLQQLADCFNLAFSDYEQSINFTIDSFKYYLTASAVDLSLSFGAFCNNELVGFILNSSGIYNNEAVVFDAGTGIVPEHRGKKVFSELFAYTSKELKNSGITQYYLEVLQSNQYAVNIYSKKGFVIKREYSVLTASGSKYPKEDGVEISPYQDFVAFPTEHSVQPSFEHSTHTLNQNPQLYEVRYISDLACCIYAKRNGAIVQMHYNDINALKCVISDLVHQYPKLMAKNVDLSATDVIKLLTDVGFNEILRQYEMVKAL